MIVEYIRYALQVHRPDELMAAYAAAGAHLQAAPECLGYELSHCEEDPAALIVRICWTSTSDHLEGFRKGPNFPPFLDCIRPFIPEIAEMRHYALTDTVWSRSV